MGGADTFISMSGVMLDAFFTTVSPHTLASLIADVQVLGTGADLSQLNLDRKAKHWLIQNVGLDEAERMIQAAVGANYGASRLLPVMKRSVPKGTQ
jgi:hypothetical protein